MTWREPSQAAVPVEVWIQQSASSPPDQSIKQWRQTTAISRNVPVPHWRYQGSFRGAAATNLTQEDRPAAGSIDPELLLQTRRRRRVLEHQPLVRIDIAVRLLGHQRTLMEAAQDELELAGIGVDVADRKNSGHAALERRGLDRHQIILQRNTPVRDRPELHGQAEERQHGVAVDFRDGVVAALAGGAGQHAVLALQFG